MFLILSGFGLDKSWISYEKKNPEPFIKRSFRFVSYHLLKLMISYWFIYLLFVPFGFFAGRSFAQAYNGNWLYMLLDFLGIADLTGTPMYNETWWFMGVIILFYILFPLFIKLMKITPMLLPALCLALTFASFIPDWGQIRTNVFSFVVGMVISKYCIFDIMVKKSVKLWASSAVSGLLIIAGLLFRYSYHNACLDALTGLGIIMLSACVFSKIHILSKVLELLGKLSGSIFMFHSFVYLYYSLCSKFVYVFRLVPLIFIVVVLLCVVLAQVIELLKKYLRVNDLTALLRRRIYLQ